MVRDATYDALSQASRSMQEWNDCAVIATAIATGYEEDYEGVRYAFELCGRRPRSGTPFHITKKVVGLLDCTIEEVTHHFSSRTIRTLEREMRHRKGRYLVRTGGRTVGHLVAIKDGKVMDWSKGRCKRIKEIYRVKDKEL